MPAVGAQQEEGSQLRSQVAQLQAELQKIRRQHIQTVEALKAENESLLKHNEMLQGEVGRLRRVESDRLVRSALDGAHERREARSSPMPSVSMAHSMPAEPSFSAHSASRPPRAPTPSAHFSRPASPPEAREYSEDLDASAVDLDDSLASSKSLLRALQGSQGPHSSHSEADTDGARGELDALLRAITAASSTPHTSTTAAATAASLESSFTVPPSQQHVLNGSIRSIQAQLAHVTEAQQQLLQRTGVSQARAQQAQEAASQAAEAAKQPLSAQLWQRIQAGVPGDRLDLFKSYLAQFTQGSLPLESLVTRARVLLVDSVAAGSSAGDGRPVASRSERESMVQAMQAELRK